MNVLLLSGTASAINYISSLAGDPAIRLHVTDADPYCPGLYAEGVIPHRVPRARDTEAYRAALDRVIADHSMDVLIPTSDYDAEGVIEYLHDGWTPPVALFRPSWEVRRRLAEKHRLMAHLTPVLPAIVPRTWSRQDAEADIIFPVVVKPIAESGGKGLEIVECRENLAAAVARTAALFGDGYIIQQYVPGRTYIVSLVYDHEGRLVVAVPMRSHQTFFTWGGGGCAGELVDDDEIVRLSIAVIAAGGGWRGPINVEWRRHQETGRYYLLEVNCRLNGYSYLTTMNGVCLPRVVLSLLTGAPLPPLDLPPPESRKNFVIGFRETLIDRWID